MEVWITEYDTEYITVNGDRKSVDVQLIDDIWYADGIPCDSKEHAIGKAIEMLWVAN